jgi:phosphonate transport system ATP-binding protein
VTALPPSGSPSGATELAPDILLKLSNLDVAPSATASAVLTGISLTIRRGECVALVGPSGSGKTTLLRTIAAMIPPSSGNIVFDGIDVAQLNGESLRGTRARIGMITQQHDLVAALRVDKNVMAGALGRWSTWHALRFLFKPNHDELAEAEAALAKVGLADKLRHSTAALSGGEQQRVAIARALIQAPALLLADEPIASLDPVTASEVLGLLTRLARSSGMALICSLHQPELAAKFCDRVLETRDGTVRDDTRVESVSSGISPAHR